jgi:hypothetical protein
VTPLLKPVDDPNNELLKESLVELWRINGTLRERDDDYRK